MPEPTPAPTLSRVEQQVWALFGRGAEVVDPVHVALDLKLHPDTVSRVLRQLAGLGLIERAGVRYRSAGRGRPHTRWRAAPARRRA